MLKDVIIRFIRYILSKLEKPVKEIEMGRPKKVKPVETEAQKINEALDTMISEGEKLGLYQESAPKVEPVKEVSLNNVAYSIARNPVNQRWVVLSINYDMATKKVGEIKIIEESLDRIDVLHRYQVLSGTEFCSEV